LNPDLGLALELCDGADAMTMRRFRAGDLVVHAKPDLTPVSDADRDVEEFLRARLTEARPDHGIVGEELGVGGGASSEWRWLIDPIDGTKNYVRGIPVFATLLCLQHRFETVVAVVSAPGLGRRWWAVRGEGAYAEGRRVQVSEVGDLSDALLSYDDIGVLEARHQSRPFVELARACWRARSYSDFWGHMLVAEGSADVMVQAEPEAKVWDLAPLQVIVEEAGGRFTDLEGRAGPDGGTAVSSNGRLHDQVLAALQTVTGSSS
jgi:histidinol-phosphatase